jgi:tetratricopeptide (TPR) repeat protein
LSAINTFLLLGPKYHASALRSLVTLRRLPPGPPDSLIRGAQASLLGTALDDEPYAAWIGYGLASYQREYVNDAEGAVEMAERMSVAAEKVPSSFVHLVVHARLGEVYLLTERGEEARKHLAATLPLLTEINATVSFARLKWSLALAYLLTGDVDEAERCVDEASLNPDDDPVGLCMRAEIMLARGESEAGLRTWRRVVDRFGDAGVPVFGVDSTVHGAWALEIQAVTVVAHAQHDRLDLVEGIAGKLPGELDSALRLRPSMVDFPTFGAVLVAIAMTDIAHGLTVLGARMLALAVSFRFTCRFQPTMSPGRARAAGERADREAYADAVSAYAGLDHEALPRAALALLEDRVTEPDRG